MEAKIRDYSQDVPALSHFSVSCKDHVDENRNLFCLTALGNLYSRKYVMEPCVLGENSRATARDSWPTA